jgi:acyl-CoA reductase-like NAD-dependent aldehyde dehydrogenase
MTTEVRAPSVPIYLAGEFVEAGTPLEIHDPATGELVATTFQAGADELERAIAAAVDAFERTRRLASYERRDALAHVAACIERDADELATLLSRESGKPIKDARGEVARGALTFRTAAEEALRINGFRSTGRRPTAAATASCAAIPSARSPASARSTSRSTWRRTRSRRPSRPGAASCSSRRRRTR